MPGRRTLTVRLAKEPTMTILRHRSIAWLVAIGAVLTGGGKARATNMKLDVELVVCTTGSATSNTKQSRLTIRDAGGATVFQQINTAVLLDDKCEALFTVNFTPEL